jgi:hypothetical protein
MPDESSSVTTPKYSCDLLPQHAAILSKSAISPEVAEARGYYSLKSRADVKRLGFLPRQGNVPALGIPIRDVHRRVPFVLIRPDQPRRKDLRTIKYEQPKNTILTLDVPPSVHPILCDPSKPLWVVDGPRQADAMASSGVACVATLGYRSWRHFRRTGRPLLSDWDHIRLDGRQVIVAFGSDVFASHAGRADVYEFTCFLQNRGANVKYAIPESEPNGKRVAIDDVLAAGKDPNTLLTDPPEQSALVPTSGRQIPQSPYHLTPEGFLLEVIVGDEVILKPLTQNWGARIVSDILLDDGLEQKRLFEIEGFIQGETRRFRLTPSRFEEMAWPLEELGPRAITMPGAGVKDHVRAAIQCVSSQIATRKEYAHTGWARHNGKWVFLHAKGAIGAESVDRVATCSNGRPATISSDPNDLVASGPVGPVSTSRVDRVWANLPTELAAFSLPPPPTDTEIVANRIHMALWLLEAADERITFPLLSFVFRAVITSTNFSLHLVGATGTLKTSLATIIQQFLGKGLDAEHLVGNWQGTANSLESLAFHLKDMVLLIDDFSPTGSRSDIQRSHRDAERLLRAKGNAGGRSRCLPDGSYKAPRSPRAAILITGEDIPEGHSLRARMLTIEVREGDVRPEELAKCQRLASLGRFAECLSAFIQWLSPRYDETLEYLRLERDEWKTHSIPSSSHRRTYNAIKDLEFGFHRFLDFAREFNALNDARYDELAERLWGVLQTVGLGQEQHHQFANPVEQFEYLLSALFASKRVHVADRLTYGVPENDPEAWGYRERLIDVPHDNSDNTVPQAAIDSAQPDRGHDDVATDDEMTGQWPTEQKKIWVPSGTKIGWVSSDDLYLIPEITFAEIQGLAYRLGTPIPLTMQMLEKRLADADIILRDVKRNRIRSRISVEGARQYVLLIPIARVRWLTRFGYGDDQQFVEGSFDDLVA